MNKQEVVDFLKKIQKFLFEKKQYESSRDISSAIDVLEDMINSPYYYENLDESKNNKKIKITKNQLKQIIKEEAIKLQRKNILESRKKEIIRELRMLNEGVSIDENGIVERLKKELKEYESSLYNFGDGGRIV